ncbi:MAG: DUF3306 domain-containing protein, partial [Microvirga sp.]
PDAAEAPAGAPLPEGDPASVLPEPELTPEELAALPKVEEITAASDISGFLRRGVPDALRNAALRRMWTLDPAIRDFVGEARDYAYDWNTPGGVPGAGALDPGDDVAAMVRSVFGESPPAAPPLEAKGSQNREAVAASPGNASQVAATQQEEPSGQMRDSHSEAATPDPMTDALAAPQSDRPQKPAPAVAAPRHGGAKPV